MQIVSATRLIDDYESGLHYYLISDKSKFFPNRWTAISHGFSIGLTQNEIDNQIRCCYKKNLSFDAYDWTKEPKGDFDDMCVDKLNEYRDNYSFVSLLYSGGADSHYLLRLLTQNKIKVDELICYRSALPGYDNAYTNLEIDNIALAHLKKTDLSPIGNPIITISQIDNWDIVEKYLKYDWSFNKSSNLLQRTPMTTVQMTIDKRPNKSVILRGTTEPMVYYDEKLDKYYTEMWNTENWIDAHQTTIKTPFFTNPEYPELHIKQCHIMKNWLREHNSRINSRDNLMEYKSLQADLVRGGKEHRINTGGAFFNKKSGDSVFTEKKSIHFARQLKRINPQLLDIYMYSVNTALKGVPVKKMGHGVLMGRYYLE